MKEILMLYLNVRQIITLDMQLLRFTSDTVTINDTIKYQAF